MGLMVHQFVCSTDNFGLLAHDEETGATASIDAPDDVAIAVELERLGWRLTEILLTHHHADHVQGAPGLRRRYPQARLVGARKDAHRLPALDLAVGEGDTVKIGVSEALVLEAPGHTTGHVLYYFERDDLLFTGDTLFSLGCGRVFETGMETMYRTLARIAGLPQETIVYCGHEYTQANARFALTVDPENSLLAERAREVDALREAGEPTLPTTIALELATNPFLRAEDVGVRQGLGMENADAVAVFAELRGRKDRFRG